MSETKNTKIKKASAKKKAVSKPTVAKKPSARKKSKARAADESVLAVIETGGKQYPVYVGDVITIEKREDAETGKTITFDSVVLVDDGATATIGTPYVDGAHVEGEVEEVGRSRKLDVVRFRSKSRTHSRYGHRQPYCTVRVTKIA